MNKWDKKQQHRASDSHHEEHVDEKWLVSYADMMTLLFGLFVILFSISMENQATFQDNLKKISDSTTRNPSSEEKQPSRNWEKELAEERERREEAERKLALLNQEILANQEKLNSAADLERQLAELKKLLANSNDSKAALSQKSLDVAKLLVEKEKMAAEIRRLDEDLRRAKEFELKVAVLEDQVRKSRELEAKLTLLEEELRKSKALESKTADLEAQLNQAKQLEIKSANLAKENKSSEREISSLQAIDLKNQSIIEKQREEIRNLTKMLDQAKQDIVKLNEELKLSERKNGDNQSYLFVILKWSTEKHDLDLTVADPSGKEFNFKKKAFEGSPGLFALDSRSGPGAEIWQSTNPTPGIYTIRIKMYNNYGNNEQAVVSGSIFSNKSSLAIENRKLDSKSGSMITLKVSIDEKGVAKLQ